MALTVTVAMTLALGAAQGSAAALTRSAAAIATSGGCAWQVELTGGAGSLTDSAASYWETTMSSVSGMQVTFQGSFPTARYMSFSLVDPNGEPTAAPSQIYDAQLTASSGVNRFQVGQSGSGTYAFNVVAGPAPSDPEPNTLYTGTTNGEAVGIIYRIYDSNAPGDVTGGVGLPSDTTSLDGVTQTTAGGCYSPASAGPATSASALRRAVSRADGLGSPSASVARVRPDVISGYPARPLWFGPGTSTSNTTNRNLDAGVLGTAIYPAADEVVVVRMRAPSFPDTDIGQPPWQAGQQVRYWSICSYYTPSNDLTACVYDANAVLSNGYASFVISTAANRPTNATTADGVNWMSLGGVWDNTLVYRQLLASPTFAQANIRHPFLPFLTMGAYYPSSAYCAVTKFEQVGVTGCLG